MLRCTLIYLTEDIEPEGEGEEEEGGSPIKRKSMMKFYIILYFYVDFMQFSSPQFLSHDTAVLIYTDTSLAIFMSFIYHW